MNPTPKPQRKDSSAPTEISTVGIVGVGSRGSGLAQLCALKGFSVQIYDTAPEAAATARKAIEEGLAVAVAKGTINSRQAGEAASMVSYPAAIRDLADAGLVVESVSEKLDVKRFVFKELDSVLGPGSIIATNTSTMRVKDIAEAVSRPGRVVGLHFFDPPVTMKLVEVVRTRATEEAFFQRAWTFALELGKMPVAVNDSPGFIVNRVVRPFYLEALRLAGEGRGDFGTIDKSIKARGGPPMGPFESMDLIGLDVDLSISRSIYEAFGRPARFEPHFIQEQLVKAGFTGRNAGKGFYKYEGGRATGDNPEALHMLPTGQTWARPRYLWDRIMRCILQEAERAAADGVAAPADIDTAVQLAMNFPKGPFEWKREYDENEGAGPRPR